MLADKQIREITYGAISVEEKDGAFSFYRFEKDARRHYGKVGETTSAVLLDFYTDSESFSFDYECERAINRDHCFFDLYENGVLIKHFGNFISSEEKKTSGHFEASLSKGEKRITLYLPNLWIATLSNITLDEGAFVKKHEKKKKLLMMGDSITHGFDAYFPSLSYANLIAKKFDFDMTNQAIGGEMFKEASLPESSSLTPDYITVAYGTNDWSWSEKTLEECVENARKYFKKLTSLYKNSKIIYISPLYRGDNKRITSVGDLDTAIQSFSSVAREYGCDVIDGRTLIPHDAAMFEDRYLHPNDLGFTRYADALYDALCDLGVMA